MSVQPPPKLQHLSLKDVAPFRAFRPAHRYPHQLPDVEAVPYYIPFFRAPSASLPPTLKNLDVTYEKSAGPDFVLLDPSKYFIQAAAKIAVEKFGGVILRVFTRQHGRYFPPFLYGEREPEDELVYAGVGEGFVGKFAEHSTNKKRLLTSTSSSSSGLMSDAHTMLLTNTPDDYR